MYSKPWIEVNQLLEVAPDSVEGPSRTCVIGPHLFNTRYDVSGEKALGGLGAYNPDAETCYAWPNKPVGAPVKLDDTRVFIDGAMLRYWNSDDVAGVDIRATFCDPDVGGHRNRIRAEDLNWATHGSDARHASLGGRDVQVGDRIRVSGGGVDVDTYVAGLVNDIMASSIESVGAASGNAEAEAGVDAELLGEIDTGIVLTPNGAAYAGIVDGDVTEVYDVEVTRGGTPGVSPVPQLRVISASGNDDVASVDVTDLDTDVAIGTRGLVVQFSDGGGSDEDTLEAGQAWRITVSQAWTASVATVAGDYMGPQDTIYLIEVLSGGTWDQGPVVRVRTNNGVDAGGPYVIPGENPADNSEGSAAIAVGSYGLTLQFAAPQEGLSAGDRFYAVVNAAAAGRVRTLVVGRSLPLEILASSGGVVASGSGFDSHSGARQTYIRDGIVNERPRYRGISDPSWTIEWIVEGNPPPGAWEFREDGVTRFSSNVDTDYPHQAWQTDPDATVLLVPPLDVQLFIRKDIEIPEVREGTVALQNFVAGPTEVCIEGGLVGYDASWSSGGDLLPLPVTSGQLFVQYAAYRQDYVGRAGSVALPGDVADALGTVSPANPLAYGAFRAAMTSSGVEVVFVAVADDSVDAWAAAAAALQSRDDVINIVPLTFDRAKQDVVVAHVKAMSGSRVGRWRRAWLSTEVPPWVAVLEDVDGEAPMGVIEDDPLTSGTQYTLVTFETEGVSLTAAGVRPGDVLRTAYAGDDYDEYVIEAVISDNELRLVAGPGAPVETASVMQVWRRVDSETGKDLLVSTGGSFADGRAVVVWPDQIRAGGADFAGYYLACTLAGMTSGVVPNQGLTQMEIPGVERVTRTTEFFTEVQLDEIARAGIWIVTQDPSTGAIYTRHALASSGIEEMAVRNADNVSYACLAALRRGFIGVSNVTPENLARLRTVLTGTLNEKSVSITTELGPQILDFEIVDLFQHPVNRDHVVATVEIEYPSPLNRITLNLVFQVGAVEAPEDTE